MSCLTVAVTPCPAQLQSQKSGMLWEYTAGIPQRSSRMRAAGRRSHCCLHPPLSPAAITSLHLSAKCRSMLEEKPQNSSSGHPHEVAFSAPELGLQKAPAKYPGTPAFHARALPWVAHPRQQCSEDDVNPALPGSHARWFGASSVICWQREAVNHLLRINTPPWTRQPPALLCASLPHRNPNPYRYKTPFCCPPPVPGTGRQMWLPFQRASSSPMSHPLPLAAPSWDPRCRQFAPSPPRTRPPAGLANN